MRSCSMASQGREATQWWDTPDELGQDFRHLGNSQYPGTPEEDHADDAKREQKNDDLLKPGSISRSRGFAEWISQTGGDKRRDR
jgi:hypothetical protein